MKSSYLFIVTIFVLITSLGIQDSFAANPEFIIEINESRANTPSNVINVDLNPSALTSERMNLSIFGNTLEITHEQTIFRNSTDYTYVGSTTDSKNNVFVTVFGDQVRAEISLLGQNYILTPTALNHQIGYYPNDLDLTNDLGIHATSPSNENPDWQNIIATFPTFEYSDDQVNDIIIDVIFLYTPNAFNEKGISKIHLMANQGIDKTNIAFEESDIPIRLVNVEIDPVGSNRGGSNYVEVSMHTDLERLIIKNDDYMERGNAVRDNENADIGVLLNKIGDRPTDNCGLAADILGDEVNAFVAVNVMCEQESLIGNVIGHEIGHLFGARHQTSNDPFSIPFEFGHGLETGRQTGYQTMMHSNPCNPDDAGCFWQTRWSDPDERFFGTLISTGTVQYENNAKVMALAAPYIASFRGGDESYSITTPTVIVNSFYDDFETNMDKWFLKSGTQWQTKIPHYNPNSDIIKVAGTSNCDIRCSMTMIDRVDLTNMAEPTLSFDRFVDTRVDSDEGLFVYISTDNGLHWIELESFTENNNKNDDVWNFQEYSLDSYSSDQIKVKFDAISSSSNEFTEIDNIRVFDAAVVIDTTPPVISLNGNENITLQVGTIFTEPGYSATDDIDGDITVNVVITGTVDTTTLGTYTLFYNVIDSSNNPANTVTRTVNIVDTTIPVITLNGITPIDVEFGSVYTDAGATATDNIDGVITASIVTVNPVNTSILGSYQVTYDVSDLAGNPAVQKTRTVTVIDTIDPVFSFVPSNQTFEATAVNTPLSSSDYGTATATDASGIKSTTNNAPSTFPIGNTIITWTATDNNDRSNTAAQTVTIEDTTKPEITVNEISYSIEESGIFTEFTSSATDNIDGDISASVSVGGDTVDTSIVGVYNITFDVSDAAGNPADQVTRTVTVNPAPDRNPPTLTIPDNITAEATAILTPVDIGNATATDDVDPNPIVVNYNSLTEYPLGDTFILWVATDASGNNSTDTQTITITDFTKPVLTIPSDVTLVSDTPLTLTESDYGRANATDIFTPVIIANNATAIFQLGETIIEWTATDANNNPSTGIQTITINRPLDTTKPVITLNGITPPLEVGVDTYTELGATVTDNDPNYSETVTVGGDIVNTNIVGSYTVTYNAPADASGNNPDQVTRTVNVDPTPGTNVTWQNVVGLSIDNNDLTKTAPTNWSGNSGASSVDSLPSGDGSVTTVIAETTSYRMIGLSNGDPDQHYLEGDFFMYLHGTGVIYIYENSVNKGGFGNYQSGDILKVAVESGVVKYYNNDVLLYTSSQVPVYPLLVDTFLYDTGATLNDVQIFGDNWKISSDPTPPVLRIIGVNTQLIVQNDPYIELRATCIDETDGDISDSIVVDSSSVDTAIVGTYQVTYDCTDDAGNNVQVTRTVSIIPQLQDTNMTWKNIVGVSIDDNSLTKTAPDAWYNAGASSVQSLPSGDGYVTTIVGETNTFRMIGLTNGDPDQLYTGGDFFMYLHGTGVLPIYENGVGKGTFGTYQSGDTLKVAVESGVVKYYNNDVLLYTSLESPVYPLLVDTFLYDTGATLNGVQISGDNWEIASDTVTWQNVVGVSIDDNNLTKTASAGWGNSGASSAQSLSSGDGYVITTIDEINTHRMIGLSNGDSNQHYTDIDFGMTPKDNSSLQVWESGAIKSNYETYQTGDILKVAVELGVVNYYKNDILFYTSLQTPVYPLLVDTALDYTGATLNDVQIFGSNWE